MIAVRLFLARSILGIAWLLQRTQRIVDQGDR